ncbi:MAG: hypothetical protein RL375_949 [Pseudomonadota bacterium]
MIDRSLFVRGLPMAAFGVLLAGSALAQSPGYAPVDMRPFMAVGLTGGGDEIATFDFTDGSSETINAGELVELRAGVHWRLDDSFSLRGSLGYHVSSSTASNGSFRFDRFPVELTGLYQASQRLRLGLGVRKAMSARTHGSGAAAGLDGTFTASTGALGELEYFYSPNYSLYGRVVAETYTSQGVRYSGNHVGVGINIYF